MVTNETVPPRRGLNYLAEVHGLSGAISDLPFGIIGKAAHSQKHEFSADLTTGQMPFGHRGNGRGEEVPRPMGDLSLHRSAQRER